ALPVTLFPYTTLFRSNDSLVFNLELSERSATNYLNLNGDIHFAHNSPAYIHFRPSFIVINKDTWALNEEAKMHISQGKVYINDRSDEHTSELQSRENL